ncbi:MAG: methyltransferase [Acidobacteria bacterium]|nr:MAG: methyltransferase [Acidobacteriota bacterium]
MERERQENQVRLISLAEGFLYANVLFALHRLGVFRLLDSGPKTLPELAAVMGCDEHRLMRALRGGLVTRLLEVDHENRYQVSGVVKDTLGPAADPSLDAWMWFLYSVQPAICQLDKTVLSGQPIFHFFSQLNQAEIRQFSLAMHNYAKSRGADLPNFLDLSGYKTLLDVGTGPGTYAFELAAKYRQLEISLLDLPSVLEVAKEIEAHYSLENQPHYLPLDFGREEIPGKYDVVLVSNTLHTIGPASSRALLKRLYSNVNSAGCLVVQAQFIPDHQPATRCWPVVFDLILMSITPTGENHGLNETIEWLKEAGFLNVASCRMSLLNTNSYVIGYR